MTVTDIKPTTRQRRMARVPLADASVEPRIKTTSKLDQVEALLCRDAGASIAEMMAVTGWQQHSVRGAMAGALKKRGLTITSEKIDGLRRYRAVYA